MKRIFVMLAVIACTATMAVAEKQTVSLYVPDMECNNCKSKVENVLAYEKGIRKLGFDVQKRLVTVTYEDRKTSVEKLQDALMKYLNYKSVVVKQGEVIEHQHGNGAGHDHHHDSQD